MTLYLRLFWNQYLNRTKRKAELSLILADAPTKKSESETWHNELVINSGGSTHENIWRPKMKQATSVYRRGRLQKCVWLGITGTLRTTPTAALEACSFTFCNIGRGGDGLNEAEHFTAAITVHKILAHISTIGTKG